MRLHSKATTPLLSCLLLAGWILILLPDFGTAAQLRKTYLTERKSVLIGVGAALPLIVEQSLPPNDSAKAALIGHPILLDNWAAHALGGRHFAGKSNFLDSDGGSAITPIAGALGLATVNLTWPEGRPGKDALQDLYLYNCGIWATAGITGIAKHAIARPRPFQYYYPDSARIHEPEYSETRKSFFSGHASSSFFAMTYLNKRVRTVMRQRLSFGDYRNWRWLPPTILFGWSSYVGLTRIRCYKHYLSDVAVGAAAGALLAEFFYRLADETEAVSDANGIEKPIFMITLPL